MAGKTMYGPAFKYGVIVYDDYRNHNDHLVPDQTLTPSIDLNYNNREVFKTYLECLHP
ncbi:MAG: hypothetical protein WKF87_17920 [Chryseolinea sp.]